MAKRQSRFMVGLFVITGVLIGVAAIVWLGAANYFQKGTRYVTYFDESVQGLQVDSRVKYRGVEVGSVERIGVAPDQRLVEVVVKIDLEGDVEQSIVTQLKAAGITGIVFVELDRRQPEETVFLPPAGMKTDYPVIPSQPSQTKQMLSSIDRIMEMIVQVDLKGISDQIKADLAGNRNLSHRQRDDEYRQESGFDDGRSGSQPSENRPDPRRRKGRVHSLDGGTGTWRSQGNSRDW